MKNWNCAYGRYTSSSTVGRIWIRYRPVVFATEKCRLFARIRNGIRTLVRWSFETSVSSAKAVAKVFVVLKTIPNALVQKPIVFGSLFDIFTVGDLSWSSSRRTRDRQQNSIHRYAAELSQWAQRVAWKLQLDVSGRTNASDNQIRALQSRVSLYRTEIDKSSIN